MSGAADTGKTLRLFVALLLPDRVRRALAAWAGSELAPHPGLAVVDEGSLHVTLCFLGEQAGDRVAEIAAACAPAAARPAVTLALGTPVWLPPRRPRVVAIEVGDEHGALAALASSVAAALARAGFIELERRPFRGHVTVARVRGRARAGRLPHRLAAPEPLRFDADAVCLMRSLLGSGPARYETLSSVILDG